MALGMDVPPRWWPSSRNVGWHRAWKRCWIHIPLVINAFLANAGVVCPISVPWPWLCTSWDTRPSECAWTVGTWLSNPRKSGKCSEPAEHSESHTSSGMDVTDPCHPHLHPAPHSARIWEPSWLWVVWIDPCILLNPAPSSFQVPWFGTIPIAVSNDISEQSLEEFRREVRNLLGCHLGCPWCWQGWDVDDLCLLCCLRGVRSI